jgi:hypothetical protein
MICTIGNCVRALQPRYGFVKIEAPSFGEWALAIVDISRVTHIHAPSAWPEWIA